MPTTDSAKLYGHWLGMWNGDLTVAAQIVADDCVIHHPSASKGVEDARPGAERIAAMVREGRALFQRLVFTLEVGPIEEGDKVAARWTGRGAYAGGVPGATATPGTIVEFSGIDLLRVRDGRIAEYWGSSDALHLWQQLGVGNSPERR